MQRRNTLILAGICLFSAVFWGLSWHADLFYTSPTFVSPLLKAEWYTDDLRVQLGDPAPKCDQLVFLGIDQPNYSDVFSANEIKKSEGLQLICQQFPWSRKVWALAIDRLCDAGAKAVIIDLLFFTPGQGDNELSEAIKRHPDKVILAANIKEIKTAGLFTKFSAEWPCETVLPSDPSIQVKVGFANFGMDPDGTIRRAEYRFTHPASEGPLLTLAGQALLLSGHEGLIPPAGQSYRFRFAGPPETYRPYHIYEIFDPVEWQGNFDSGKKLRGKIIIIGPAGNWTQDTKQTPYAKSYMLGPELHLHALGAALTGSFLHETSPKANCLLIAGAALCSFLILYFTRHPALRLFLLLLGTLAYAWLALQLYNHAGWIILCVPTLLTFNTGGALGLLYEYFQTLLEKIRTRATFEKYVSKNVVNAILDQSKDFEKSLGGTRKPCTMLFSDIRGFTTMTEQGDSQQVVAQLNEYLTAMVECVFRHEGTLDKFMGDAVVAVWGNVQTAGPESDAIRAVSSALDMLTALQSLNKEWASAGRLELQIGIGINHGDVIVGNMGSPHRKEFTVIGDAVNLASRLEGATKEYEIPLILGESAAPLVRSHFVLQTVDLLRVKGKTRPVDTFTVQGRISVPLPDKHRQALDHYEKAMTEYRAGRFSSALAGFESALALWPENTLSRIYTARATRLIQAPPESWDGVYVMKTK